MSRIGPQFLAELIAAGLNGLPFSWNADGVHGTEALTVQQLAALDAVVAAHNPEAPPTPSTDPVDYPLTPAQFKAMIEISGHGPAVEAAIEAIPDVTTRAVVRAKYFSSTEYRRDSKFVGMIRPAVGISSEDLDALWMTAKDLPV